MNFSNAWDSYMAEYEQAAYISLTKLNSEHHQEMLNIRKKISSDYPIMGKPINKKIIDLTKREKALTQNKLYDAAERLKRKREALEVSDIQNFIKQDIKKLIDKEEIKIKTRHETALTALLKRIQRDRNEQLLNRQIDSKRMIQRNKNMIQHIIKRQDMEKKKTREFLHYSLGTREPAKKVNSKTRTQSSKRKRLRKIQAIENINDNKEPKSFFITERTDTYAAKLDKRLNKSNTGIKIIRPNRSTSVTHNDNDSTSFEKPKRMDNRTSVQNRSAYGTCITNKFTLAKRKIKRTNQSISKSSNSKFKCLNNSCN
jgi:hypothetical protein